MSFYSISRSIKQVLTDQAETLLDLLENVCATQHFNLKDHLFDCLKFSHVLDSEQHSYCSETGQDIIIPYKEYIFNVIVPFTMIRPCIRCKQDFNSEDDYYCIRIKSSNIPYPDICETCFNQMFGGQINYSHVNTYLIITNAYKFFLRIKMLPLFAKLKRMLQAIRTKKLTKLCIMLAKKLRSN